MVEVGLPVDVVSDVQSLLSQMQQVVGNSLKCWEGVVHRDAMRAAQYRMEAVMLVMMYDAAVTTIIMKAIAANVAATAVVRIHVIDSSATVLSHRILWGPQLFR